MKLWLALLLLLPGVASAQARRALILGIDTYQPPGTTPEHPAGCIYGRRHARQQELQRQQQQQGQAPAGQEKM